MCRLKLGLALLCILFSALPTLAAPPNIIFIMADDLGYGDLGCYGGQKIATPNIDALATEGLRFTQAYAGGPVCTSSRSALITGLHNGHGPARDNIPHYHTYLQEEDITIAEVLQQAGYRCGGVGKWSLGDAGTVGRATNQGFDTWFGYLNQDHAHYYYPEYLDDDEGRLELTGNTTKRFAYSHELLTDRALQFIQENKDGPFFLYASYTVPHFSSRSEDPDRLTIPDTAPYSDRDWTMKGKKYAAMVHRLDKDVGRITDLLETLNLTDNTLIVFTSDNGGHDTTPAHFKTSGPLQGFKRNLTEGGIRVPFIVKWPGKAPAKQVSHEIVTFWDMLPTFADIAEVANTPTVDGISVSEAFQGKKIAQPHPYLYWDYGHCRDRFEQAVRMGDWKGIRLGKDAPLQLYNLTKDLGETNNVADAHPKIVKQITRHMDEAFTPHERYPIGVPYTGKAIWKKNKS